MSQIKRQQFSISQAQEQYPHQFELQSIGMRIRKAVSDGYQNQSSAFSNNTSHLKSQSQSQPQQTSAFQRVPLPSNIVVPPLLTNMTSSSVSSFEEWENNLDLRLQRIDHGLQKERFNKRTFESAEEEW
ncbi:hypothetical protein WICMUC_002799 [Wickerhamomyces mucosus]|uniref:Damage-regulated import facilitator 1 n=1 Tax=Wickerhamomyces mucosus TaxID=1378264 RepID=A0A9P8PN15_9ASCO|nr:hypothetical protein WICMUC_002799 [Wickerhamomyces mucosus]